MSKKVEVYQKEVKDPLVEKIAKKGGQDFENVTLLQNVEKILKIQFQDNGQFLTYTAVTLKLTQFLTCCHHHVLFH